jgi:nitrite reductase (NADH) small subunit
METSVEKPVAALLKKEPASGSGQWVNVCSIADIPALGSRRVSRKRGPAIALFRTADDRVHALLDRCPHKGGPLSQGIVHGERVACPLHNWSIGLNDGQAAAPDNGCTPRFAVKLEGEAVMLDRGEIDTLGVDLPLPMAGPCLRKSS